MLTLFTCSGCSRQLRGFSDREVDARRVRRLVSRTIDGKILVTSKILRPLVSDGLSLGDDLVSLSPKGDLFWLLPSSVIRVDVARSKISSADPCDRCGGPLNVLRSRERRDDRIEAAPLHVTSQAPATAGFFRTDVEVGNSLMKMSLVLVNDAMRAVLEDLLSAPGSGPANAIRFRPVVIRGAA